jgi:peptidoglycan/LPS O-acetylase OafA/YrhL
MLTGIGLMCATISTITRWLDHIDQTIRSGRSSISIPGAMVRPFMSPFLYVGGLTFVALVASLVILWLLEYPAVLAAGPLPWLGRISYGVHLWHFPVNAGLFLRWSLPLRTLVVVSAALAETTTSWWIVERRFLARNSRPRSLSPRACDTAGSAA